MKIRRNHGQTQQTIVIVPLTSADFVFKRSVLSFSLIDRRAIDNYCSRIFAPVEAVFLVCMKRA